MNAERLLALFDRVADAPDAIPRLRRFALELAVRGMLAEQDPEDEPAWKLLERIEAEKARLVEVGEIRRARRMSSVVSQPFRLPSTWRWVAFGEVCDFAAGRTPSRNDLSFWNTGEYPWVSIADMEDGMTVGVTKETVSHEARMRVFKSEPASRGTMIMSFKLTIGKIARLGIPAYHNEAIIAIHPHLRAVDPYLFVVLPLMARGGDTKGAIKGATLNRESLSSIPIPLPPIAEQHRIVARVNTLESLFNRLGTAMATADARKQRLLGALIHNALGNSAPLEESA